MKTVFIGTDSETADKAGLSLRLRWPDTPPLIPSQATPGLEAVEQELPDLVILHPSFSDLSLSECIRKLRRFSNVPLLVLGCEGGKTEVVTALDSGADEYVPRTCNITELMIRVWALLRRIGVIDLHEQDSPIRCGQLLVNPITHEVLLGERPILLTATEFRLLHLLLKNQGAVVPRQTLMSKLWSEEVDSLTLLKKYVQRVRYKLGDTAFEPRCIVNVHGTGYRFVGPIERVVEPVEAELVLV